MLNIRNRPKEIGLKDCDVIYNKEMLDDDWIPATATYNYMMKDPLLDWLKYHHGPHKNARYRKNNSSNETYNFPEYIMEQGKMFEKKVMKLISKKFQSNRVIEINGDQCPRDPEKVRQTLDAMKKGIPFIHSGVLHNASNKTFGIPDLLVRSDWLKFLVDKCPISNNEEVIPAPKLGSKWHYCVIDIKFTGLLLRADGMHLLNSGCFPAYKSQLLIYNWALGNLQGYTPDKVYILGRRWKYISCGKTYNGYSCFDKLGIIDYSSHDKEYINTTLDALQWIREVKNPDASKWNVTKYPLSRWELYPNMCNAHDYPWHNIKQKIANENKELTNLWMVGPNNRAIALENGVYQWSDPNCYPENLGINGSKIGKILSEIIGINQSDKIKILPEFIENNTYGWKNPEKIEFYVDFETCNGVISTIKKLPYADSDTILFMIGVGYIHPETKKWIYKDFTVNHLTFEEEEIICKEFANYIMKTAYQHGVDNPRCIHWAKAEDTLWNNVLARHNSLKSNLWKWLDLLVVFKEEPIVINGCMSFGLKDIAAAMKKHGFIKSGWDKSSGCIDGQSAMIAARKAHEQAKIKNISMKKIPIMKQIIKYNEVDVKVLYEIITYLRQNHTLQTYYGLHTIENLLEERLTIGKRKRDSSVELPTKKRKTLETPVSILPIINDTTMSNGPISDTNGDR